MSNTTFKKISAAAIVASLGLAGASRAATTTFEGLVVGSNGGFTDNSTDTQSTTPPIGPTGVVTASGGNPGQAFAITSNTNSYSDFFNAASTAGPGTSGAVGVSFDLNRTNASALPAPSVATIAANSPTEAGFGVEILSSSNNVLASLFVENTEITAPNNLTSVPALFVSNLGTNGAANTEIFGTGANPLLGQAANDGTYGTYSLALNLVPNGTSTFTVTGPNGTSGPYTFNSTYDGSGFTVNLSSQNQGTGTVGTFDNFSVTPEPASVAMIGVGSLLLAGRRRKRMA